MGLNIKFPAQCYKCKEWFKPGHAFLHRVAGKWMAHCMRCQQQGAKEKQARLKEKKSQPANSEGVNE